MTQTLEERIEVISQLHEDSQSNGDLSYFEASAYEIFEIVKELQEQNKAWQGMVESTCQTNKALCDRLKEGADAFYSQEKKLDEALAKLEIAKKGLEALNKHCEGNSEALSILNQCYDQLIYNKQGEKHDE